MQDFDLIVGKTSDTYAVAFYDARRDNVACHFSDFKKSDAKEICKFINHVKKMRRKFGVIGENFAQIIQIDRRFYVTKSFELSGGRNLTVSSCGFSSEISACRCAAILEISDVQDVSDH